ncbi:hypothetical protein UT300003_24680 [Clostridium sardiniense]
MNVWSTICLVLAIIFLIVSIIFAVLKEKATIIISGFNSFSKEKRERYDKKKMSIDMRNSFLLWAIILFLGAILSYFISNYFAIIAIIIWVILFIKDVHIDPEKAFRKYRKSPRN